MSSEFDTNDFPLAYLITFHTYGTWLHGDNRGSMNRKHNIRGMPRIAPNAKLRQAELVQLKHSPVILSAAQRRTIESAAQEVCHNRRYALLAINVRTNHVHAVVSAVCRPERIMDAMKAYATRKLRQNGLISLETKPWVRHGSTRYLWKEQHVEKAIDYVLHGQGDDPPNFED